MKKFDFANSKIKSVFNILFYFISVNIYFILSNIFCGFKFSFICSLTISY